MGTWGTDIQDNDIYADVESEFLEQLAENKTPKELYKYFIEDSDFNEEISEETHDWWFAIADVFWKIDHLDTRVFLIVKNIIETKADIIYWKDCDADEEDIQEREEVLKQFLNKISKPIEKPMVYDDF